jgi:hypothetical protein
MTGSAEKYRSAMARSFVGLSASKYLWFKLRQGSSLSFKPLAFNGEEPGGRTGRSDTAIALELKVADIDDAYRISLSS